jgi:hypothetical protein
MKKSLTGKAYKGKMDGNRQTLPLPSWDFPPLSLAVDPPAGRVSFHPPLFVAPF